MTYKPGDKLKISMIVTVNSEDAYDECYSVRDENHYTHYLYLNTGSGITVEKISQYRVGQVWMLKARPGHRQETSGIWVVAQHPSQLTPIVFVSAGNVTYSEEKFDAFVKSNAWRWELIKIHESDV